MRCPMPRLWKAMLQASSFRIRLSIWLIETWERGIGIPFKRILEHPYDEMFKKQEFVGELKALGFDVEIHENSPLGFYHFWGRAEKTS
jgi:hypothetical protein